MTNQNRISKLAAALAAALLAAAPASAQEGSWSKYNYGFQASALMPNSDDLKFIAGNGYGLAGYVEKVWSSSWALRGRLEYIQFGEKDIAPLVSTKLNQTGLMVDAIYYMGHKDVLYPFAGIGYFNRSLTFNADGSAMKPPVDSELAYCLGVGWNFTSHLGLELKYSQCDYAWTQVSMLWRF